MPDPEIILQYMDDVKDRLKLIMDNTKSPELRGMIRRFVHDDDDEGLDITSVFYAIMVLKRKLFPKNTMQSDVKYMLQEQQEFLDELSQFHFPEHAPENVNPVAAEAADSIITILNCCDAIGVPAELVVAHILVKLDVLEKREYIWSEADEYYVRKDKLDDEELADLIAMNKEILDDEANEQSNEHHGNIE
jgi:hypothetical protein